MDPNMHPLEQVEGAAYGYYSSGLLSPHHRGFDIPFMGAQNESLPYGYYTPTHGYARSPYNPYIPTYGYAQSPYNPYIPTYGYAQSPYSPYMPSPFVGAQQYQPAVSSPAYMTSSSSPESLIDNGASVIRPDGRGSKRQFNSTFGASDDGRGSKRYFNSNFGAFYNSTKPTSKANVGPGPSKQAATNKAASSPALQGGKCTDSTQALASLANGEIPSHGSNNISDFGACNHGRATVAKLQPEVNVGISLNDINSGLDSLGEQNQDHIISKNELAFKSYTSRAGGTNAQGNNVFYADQCKKDDFPLDYTDAKFFVIKSHNVDAVRLSIAYNIWPCCRPRGTKKLNSAYEEAQRIAAGKPRGCPIFLFFSVIGSGEFCGVAEMIGPVDFNKGMDFRQRGKWGGSFPIKWHMMKVLPYSGLCHILLENNENKPVTHSTDTQEIMYSKGLEMLILYKNHALLSLPHDFMYYPNHQKATFESPFFVPNLCFVAIDTLKTSDYEDEDEDDDDDDLEKQIEAAKARTIDSPPPDMPVWDEPYKGDYLKLTPIIIDRFSVAEVILRIDLERAGVKVKDYTELRKIIAEVVELQPYKQDCLGPHPIILEKAAIDEYISRKFPKNEESEKTGVEANLDISSLDLGPLMVDLHPYELRHESHNVSTLNIGRLSVNPNPIEARDDVSTSFNIGGVSVNPKPVFTNTGTFDVTVGSVCLKFNA